MWLRLKFIEIPITPPKRDLDENKRKISLRLKTTSLEDDAFLVGFGDSSALTQLSF